MVSINGYRSPCCSDSDSDSDKVTRLFGSDMTVPRGLQISDDSFVVASATWQAYDQIICILYEN